MKNIYVTLYLLVFSAVSGQAISLADYLQLVCENNIAYAAERLNIPIAEAELNAARVFNDPTLSVEYANNSDWNVQMGQGVSAELGYTLSPGKRGARIDLARSEQALAFALLCDYLRNLRYEATEAYINASKCLAVFGNQCLISDKLAEIARGDSLRLAIGEIRSVDAAQTRIEADMALADKLTAKGEFENACTAMSLFAGQSEHVLVPDADIEVIVPDTNLDALTEIALERRADLAAALKNIDVAQKALKVEQAERKLDYDLAVGYNYNTEVKNELAPAPRFSGFTVGVAIPLKFSNRNKGALDAARLRKQQSELQYQQARLEVENQVVQAHRTWQYALLSQQHLDQNGAAGEASIVLKSYMSSYALGDVSLVELMEAFRVYSDTKHAAIEARFATVSAANALQNAIGM